MQNSMSIKLKQFFYVVSLTIQYKDGYLKIDKFPIRILAKNKPDVSDRDTRSLVFKLFRQSIKQATFFRALKEGRVILHNDIFDRVVTSISDPAYDYYGNLYTIDTIDIIGNFHFGSRIFELFSKEQVFALSRKHTIQLDPGTYKTDNFVPHGYITVSNWGGFEIMLSDCNSMAKVRDAFGSDSPKVSDWFEIEYTYDDEIGEYEPIIDPQGYNINLNHVMLSRF